MIHTFTPYDTDQDVKNLVQRFENCDFGPGEFHHSDHLTVALFYLAGSNEKEACRRMRAGLLRFLGRLGVDNAYHETITVFWIKIVKRLIQRADKPISLGQLANQIVSKCDNPQLIDLYFSKELLGSDQARKSWIEPDLKPIEP